MESAQIKEEEISKKVRAMAFLARKAHSEVKILSSFPKPIYAQDPVREKLDAQTALLGRLSKALMFAAKQLKNDPGSNKKSLIELKNLFRRKQNKVASVLRKTLNEVKASKEKIAELESERQGFIETQHRLANGLERALFLLQTKAPDPIPEPVDTSKLETHYKTLLEAAEKKQLVLQARLQKDEEAMARLKKGFEEILSGVKQESLELIRAKEAEFKAFKQEDNTKELQELKKQVALLKVHLEASFVEKKKLEYTLKNVRQNETALLEERLKETESNLEEKETEIAQIQKHLGKKLQEIASLQDQIQEQDNQTVILREQLDQTLAGIEEVRHRNSLEKDQLLDEMETLKELVSRKTTTIDSLESEIERLKAVETDFEQMAHSITQLQQNFQKVKFSPA